MKSIFHTKPAQWFSYLLSMPFLPLAGGSLLMLAVCPMLFDSTVAEERFKLAQFSHYSSGEEVPFILCRVYGQEREGFLVVRDFFGNIQTTNLLLEEKPGRLMVLTGKIVDTTQLQVTQYEIYTYWYYKAFGSLLALFFILWKLVRGVRWSKDGLRLTG